MATGNKSAIAATGGMMRRLSALRIWASALEIAEMALLTLVDAQAVAD
jgi:hypothetical protein